MSKFVIDNDSSISDALAMIKLLACVDSIIERGGMIVYDDGVTIMAGVTTDTGDPIYHIIDTESYEKPNKTN